MINKRRLLSFTAVAGVVLVLVLGGGWAAAQAREPISVGDRVQVHVYMYRHGDDALVLTTDYERARQEGEQGNPLFTGDLDEENFGPKTLRIRLTNRSMDPARFLLGQQSGDVVKIPYIVNPIGTRDDWPTFTIPRTVGPLPTEFTLDLQKTYAEGSRSWFKEQVDPAAIRAGSTVPYMGGLAATVLEADGETARLRVDLEAGDNGVVTSRSVGIPFRVEGTLDGQVLLHPILEVGAKFDTQGCDLPETFLKPGRYVVEEVGPESIVVRVRPPAAVEPLLDETVRMEYHILQVEKWPELERISSPLKNLMTIITTR